MPARGGTLPRNVRVVWSRLDNGSVAVWYTWYDGRPGINQKTCRDSSGVWILEKWAFIHSGRVRIVGGIPAFGARHVLQASPVLFSFSPWVKQASGCSATSRIFCAVRSERRFSLCRRF